MPYRAAEPERPRAGVPHAADRDRGMFGRLSPDTPSVGAYTSRRGRARQPQDPAARRSDTQHRSGLWRPVAGPGTLAEVCSVDIGDCTV